jgi:hypothetical protein
MQVEPEQSPRCDEYRSEPVLRSIASPLEESRHASNQGSQADEQSQTAIGEHSVTASGNFENSDKIRRG